MVPNVDLTSKMDENLTQLERVFYIEIFQKINSFITLLYLQGLKFISYPFYRQNEVKFFEKLIKLKKINLLSMFF